MDHLSGYIRSVTARCGLHQLSRRSAEWLACSRSRAFARHWENESRERSDAAAAGLCRLTYLRFCHRVRRKLCEYVNE